MFLGLKTDNPVAELYLYDMSGSVSAEERWQADRELAHGLLKKIDEFLHNQNVSVHDMKGLFVFEGPGSFTGLRIGMTVMDTLAYALNIPIVAARENDWQEVAIKKLQNGDDEKIILPFYGADARITQPKK